MPFSSAVLALQTNLSRLGYSPGRLDGLMGRRTGRAKRMFLRAHGLSDLLLSEAASALEGVLEMERTGMPELGADQFQAIYPRAPRAYIAPLNAALLEGNIQRERRTMFLAQLGHESGGLRYMEEIASGAAYEGRADLGNTEPGDGRRFKGRGPIQLTGRANYRRFGQLLGENLEQDPERAASPQIGFRVAVMYWTDRGLNAAADQGDFKWVTRAINGGYNGYDDRVRWLANVRDVLTPGG